MDIQAAAADFQGVGSRANVFDGPPAPVVLVAAGEEWGDPGPDGCDGAHRERAVGRDGPDAAHRSRVDAHRGARQRPDAPGPTTSCHPASRPRALSCSRSIPQAATGRIPAPQARHAGPAPGIAPGGAVLLPLRTAPGVRLRAGVHAGPKSLDEALTPMDGDMVLVPRGYHPVGMPAGYDGYYLNVMAGPSRALELHPRPRPRLADGLVARRVTLTREEHDRHPTRLALGASRAPSRDFPTDYWNNSCAAAELAWAIEQGGYRCDDQPDHRRRCATQGDGHLVAPHPGHPDQRPDADRPGRHMAGRGGDGHPRLGNARARLRAPPPAERDACRSRRTPPSMSRPSGCSTRPATSRPSHPNVQVKFPKLTAAGLRAIEEATYEGISINATVSFTVPQALAVGAAVVSGRSSAPRGAGQGRHPGPPSPVCTLMVGRLDDWVKVVCDRDYITIDPAAADWAGIAVFNTRSRAPTRSAAIDADRWPAAYRHPPAMVGAHRRGRGAHHLVCMGSLGSRHPPSRCGRASPIPCPRRTSTQLLHPAPDFRAAWDPRTG